VHRDDTGHPASQAAADGRKEVRYGRRGGSAPHLVGRVISPQHCPQTGHEPPPSASDRGPRRGVEGDLRRDGAHPRGVVERAADVFPDRTGTLLTPQRQQLDCCRRGIVRGLLTNAATTAVESPNRDLCAPIQTTTRRQDCLRVLSPSVGIRCPHVPEP
jgi:hypothetical protein